MSFIQFPIQTFPNTGIGIESLQRITTGIGNTAFGYRALWVATSGAGNVAVGDRALGSNSTGDANVSVGFNASISNITGSRNIGIGYFANFTNSSGTDNTAVGYSALSSSTGSFNTAIGGQSGEQMTTGNKNTIVGRFSGNQGGLDIRALNNYVVLSDGDGNPRLWIDNTGAVNIPGGTVLPGGVANGVLYLNASKVMTSGSALTFDGTNLGLGVIPSSWQSTRKALQIGSTGAIASASSNTIFADNWYIDSGATDRYLTNGFATIYQQSTGSHRWFIAPSGIAGNAIGFTQAMTLDANGRLGIGLTNPSSTLDVYGTFRYQASSSGNGIVRFESNNSIGQISLQNSSGTNVLQLYSAADNVLNGVNNLALAFYTNNIERVKIPATGGMVIGTGAIATNATDGFFYAPGCAGTPTGVPTAFTGRVPIVVDTTNNKLYFYSGGAWRDAGP